MANADRNLQDVVSQELNGSRSELNQAAAASETELEAARSRRELEVPELELNCWSGGSNQFSSSCRDGNRVTGLKLSRLRSPRPCVRRQRARLTARAATCPLVEAGYYVMD
jgi:hypothetical protein